MLPKFLDKLLRYMEILRFRKVEYSLDSTFLFVTATDDTHIRSALSLIKSIKLHEPKSKIIVYDLGLSSNFKDILKNYGNQLELRVFNYKNYPEYFNISINAGEYAWKPVIINEVLVQTNSYICWMDAGDRLISPLINVRKILNKYGFYSPASSGNVRMWTHPTCLDYLKASENILRYYNLCGAFIAINPTFPIVKQLIHDWYKCALTRECIAPLGSDRSNHRQDQACLTVLAHQSGITRGIPKDYYGFNTHQDND